MKRTSKERKGTNRTENELMTAVLARNFLLIITIHMPKMMKRSYVNSVLLTKLLEENY